MKIFLFILLIIDSIHLNAQAKVTKYYDANWMETSKNKATYYADFIKAGNNYNCTSYWINTNIVSGKSTYADTLMQSPIGIQVLYFKNGHVQDSSLFENMQLKYSFHYYSNNQLAVHYYLPDNKKDGETEGFDESGNKINHYIFQKEAEFKGGPKAWTSYISKNATLDLRLKGDSTGIASVQIEFIVDENGDVIKPKIFKSSGYKNVDNDALRIIADSPPWNYGIMYNKPVKSFRIQPISYSLKSEKK